MDEKWRQALIRQIRHSAVLFSVSVVFVLAWFLLKSLDFAYAYSLLIVCSIMIIPTLIYAAGWIWKGVLAVADLIKPETITTSVNVFGVHIDGYQGTKNCLFADVYRCGKESKPVKRMLPLTNCFHVRHDVRLLGMPMYYNDHTYRLTYLKHSRFIVEIEDLSSNDNKRNSLVKTEASEFAESIIKKMRKTEVAN
ncbi:MAG: hypothetical protein IKZ82_01275 [Clostridia bacterium]|nr:hypothetical protein [Clostridia bacterium]